MNPRLSNRQNAGFSIIEVLISVLILSVGLAGMVKLHKSSVDGNVSSAQTATAARIASEELDTFANTPNKSLNNQTKTRTENGIIYTVTWNQQEDAGITRVHAKVTWPDNTSGLNFDLTEQNYTPEQLYRTEQFLQTKVFDNATCSDGSGDHDEASSPGCYTHSSDSTPHYSQDGDGE